MVVEGGHAAVGYACPRNRLSVSEDEGEEDRVVPQLSAQLCVDCVGPFDLVGEYGFGQLGMYTAIHRKIKEKVTIKRVDRLSPADRQRLVRSVTLAERLKVHPNVYRHAWITQSIPHQMLFIISEHPQDNLEALVAREGALGEPRAKGFVSQLSSAVSFFHGNGVTHQALTLANVLICDGVAKVTGFEHANEYGPHHRAHALRHQMPYCSPELVAADDITKLDKTKADIWALGVITFALVTGRLPFATPDAILNDPPAFSAPPGGGPPGQSAPGQRHQRQCVGSRTAAPASSGGVTVGTPGTRLSHACLDESCTRLLNACLHKDWRNRPSTQQIRRCRWLRGCVVPALDAELDEGLVDAELAQLGATDEYVEASKTPSEYSLPAAERYLLAKRLRRELLSARTGRDDSSGAATIERGEVFCQVPELAVSHPSYPDAVGRDHVTHASRSSAASEGKSPPNDDGVVPCFRTDGDAADVSDAAGSAGAALAQRAKPAPFTYPRVGGNASRGVLKRRRSGSDVGAVPASRMPNSCELVFTFRT